MVGPVRGVGADGLRERASAEQTAEQIDDEIHHRFDDRCQLRSGLLG